MNKKKEKKVTKKSEKKTLTKLKPQKMKSLKKRKIAFIDRDGTLIKEPSDQQVDQLSKIEWMPEVIVALRKLIQNGYELVMVTNQDGLGTKSFPQKDFEICQEFILRNLRTQGIFFSQIQICPHFSQDRCTCRKPEIGLVKEFLPQLNFEQSVVIGDRTTDLKLAENIGVRGYMLSSKWGWSNLIKELFYTARSGECVRITQETKIQVKVVLDDQGEKEIHTGLKFLDHMLEQLAHHSGISIFIEAEGDKEIDDHHTVEDVGLALGQALNEALGERRGIERYGFLLPMDESLTQVALDLGGRSYFVFEGKFDRPQIGDVASEMIPHFFKSFSDSLKANLNIKVQGENAHHMAESCFKGVARALKAALMLTKNTSLNNHNGRDNQNGIEDEMNFKNSQIPSTKGSLL